MKNTFTSKACWANPLFANLMFFVCIAGIAGLAGGAKSTRKSLGGETPAVRGFIVSDDHFGWKHPMQPNNNTIAHAIGNIIESFPNLDVFIDSGDIHHGNSDDRGRSDWTEIVQGGVGELPFLLSGGNHELIGYGNALPENESESRTMSIGSVPCRPYYSFDIKGVHIVCLPEMLSPNLITGESLDWLEVDLSLNKDKTVLIITHNALPGTTSPCDSLVYRQIADEERVQAIIDSYPNVVAWMHGHNHTWELVEKNGKFYVSNGRIGGFSPPYPGNMGAGHIGGMYFEVGPDYFTVRGYSATAGCFFDLLEGYEHLTRTMKIKTSFNPKEPAAASWGMGGSRDGQFIPAYQHYLSAPGSKADLVLAGANGPVFSENSDIVYVAEQVDGWSKARSLAGLAVSPKKDVDGEIDGIRFLHPGLEILPLGPGKTTRRLESPHGSGNCVYYRCAPGKTYRALTRVEAEKPGPKCQLIFGVYDSRGNKLFEKECDLIAMTTEPMEIQGVVTIPADLKGTGIFEDESSDNLLNITIDARFEDLTVPVRVYKLELAENTLEMNTLNPKVTLGGKTPAYTGQIAPGEYKTLALDTLLSPREVVKVSAQGNHRVTWLVRQNNLKWQVRNAPAAWLPDGMLQVGPVRNRFAYYNEIIIAPLAEPDAPFVHRMRGINRCRIEPYDREKKELRIHVDEIIGEYSEIQIHNTPGAPKSFENVSDRCYESIVPRSVGVEPTKTGLVIVRF